jgi:uncharacterized protein involved in exopolysaccharide biosynthesis
MTRKSVPQENQELTERIDRAQAANDPVSPVIEATLEPDGEQAKKDETVVINMDDAKKERRNTQPHALVRSERAPNATLLVCMGANVGFRHVVSGNEITIGRSDRCDIHLDDERVSGRHCELVLRGNHYRIYDLGSSNGTLVNAQRIDEIDLRDGDLIQVGYTVFRYVNGDALDTQRFLGMQSQDPNQFAAAQQGQHQFGVHLGSAQNIRARGVLEEEVSFEDMVGQLRKLINFFWPFRKVIAGCALGGLLFGIFSAIMFPPAVAAFFDVRLHSKPSENPLERYEAPNVEFFRSAATTFRSTGLIQKTLETLGEKPDAERMQVIQEQLQFVNTGGDQATQTYTGNYRGATPEWSMKFLKTHVDNYLSGEIDKTLKIIKTQVDFLRSELAQTEKDLKETEDNLTAFKRQNIDGLPDQAKQYYDLKFELEKQESEIQTEIKRLEAQAEVDKRRVATERPMIESRIATQPYKQAIVDVHRQLAEAKARGLADDHPDIKLLKMKIEELKKLASDTDRTPDSTEVERVRNPAYDATVQRIQDLKASLAATGQERERLRQDQERVKAIVEKLPQLEAQYAELTRRYEATKTLHTRIFEQLKTTELQYELEKASATARYEIITPPRLEYINPMKTITKRGGMLMIGGLVIGVLIAVGAQARRLLKMMKSAEPQT